MVQAHEDFDISQGTQAKIKTLEGTRQYFSDFLKELKDHQILKQDPTLTEGEDYLSDEGMLKFIIIPMLKMYEKLPTPIKTDQELQDLIKTIRKTSISYVPDV